MAKICVMFQMGLARVRVSVYQRGATAAKRVSPTPPPSKNTTRRTINKVSMSSPHSEALKHLRLSCIVHLIY
jgi:hypothetical protein